MVGLGLNTGTNQFNVFLWPVDLNPMIVAGERE